MLFYLVSLVVFSPFLVPCSLANDQANVTIPATAPQIEYTPFLCVNDTSEQCENAWQTIDLFGTTFVSTHGPAPGDIIPQVFLQFHASAFYLFTSNFSNATTNFTISNSGIVVARTVNSSAGVVSVLQLPETEISTVVLTFVPDQLPTRLDIGFIKLTVTGNPASSVILPSMTLPPSPTLPIFSSAAPSSALPLPSNHGKLVAEAVGITIGLSLGLTAVVVLGCILWRRRKRWRPREDSEDDAAARPSRSLPPRESKAKVTTKVSEAGRKSRASKPKAQKKDGEEKVWFS